MTKIKKLTITLILGCFVFLGIPLVTATESRLRLLSKEPVEKSEWRPTKVEKVSSPNGKFKGAIIYGKGLDVVPVEKFILKDKKGNLIWQMSNCGATGFRIANDGSVIATTLVAGPAGPVVISFYDPKGNLLKQTDKLQAFYTTISGNFSPDENYLPVNAGKDGLLIFDLKGNLKQNYGYCREFIASAGFKNVVVTYHNNVRFYKNGELRGKKDIDSEYIRAIAMTTDGQYVVLATPKKLYLFETEEPAELWQADAGEDFEFISVDLSRQAEKVVAGLDFSARKPGKGTYGYIYVFDREGIKIAGQRIEFAARHFMIPSVDISEDGKIISVGAGENYKFELK